MLQCDINVRQEATFYTATQHDSFRQTFEQNKTTYALYGSLIKFLFDVKERLRAVQATATEWENRAKFRETQPRWTRNDEAAFREELSTLGNEAKRHLNVIKDMLQEIENLLAHMTLLRQWLLDDIGIKEARMSNRSADDVRIFTYATVIFLPLSFVSSTFAMTGPPANHIVNPFIAACFAALAATILFLLNAGTPLRNITYYKNQFLGRAQDDSILEHAASQWRDLAKALHKVVVEVPARNVLMALEIVKESRSRGRSMKKAGTTTQRHDDGNLSADAKGESKKDSKITAAEAKRNRWQQELQYTRKRRRNMSQLVVGFLLLPLVMIEFAVGFIWYGILDLLKFLFYTLPTWPIHHLEWQADHDGEDDQASIHTRDDADQARKSGKSSTETADKQQKTRKDLRDKKTEYQDEKLAHFMQVPRLDRLSRYLQQGQSLKKARMNLKARKKDDREHVDGLRRRYKTARKKFGNLPGEEKLDFSSSGGEESDRKRDSVGKDSGKTLQGDDNTHDGGDRHTAGNALRKLVGRLRGQQKPETDDLTSVKAKEEV